jgi:hypothetical protein
MTVTEMFTPEFMFRVSLTNDQDLATTNLSEQTPAEIERYLNADERNAVVLVGSRDRVFGNVTYEPPVYVLRGAGGTLDNFYYGPMPAEDPGDANGGDLDAATALCDATIEYYS